MLKLGVVLTPTGNYISGWRLPEAVADAAINLKHYIELVTAAEAAKLDLIFLADSSAIRNYAHTNEMMRMALGTSFEPTTLFGALSAVTSRIGFIGTVSTSFNEPYNVARRFASLDHLSSGRVGWNLVTSQSDIEAHNFGLAVQKDHAERYRIASEFADIVIGLWDSWSDDAFIRDKSTGIFVNPDKCFPLNHRGKYYNVAGPLNIPRTPQGRPIVAQAGSSEPGRDLAARTADVIFTAQLELPEAKAFYADIRDRARRHGREPADIKILPGVTPIVGRDNGEAQQKYEHLQSLVHPDVAISYLSIVLGGQDLSSYDPNEKVPKLPEPNGPKSRFNLLIAMAQKENLTLGQLAARVAGARGHSVLVGGPKQIADHFERWFTEPACDGFCLMPASLPGGLEDFIDLVIPELRSRGLFRTEYEGVTLRENLGLSRPANRLSAP